jgi:hypothetical protein
MVRKIKYSDEKIISALRECKGMAYLAASRIGCCYTTIYDRAKKNEKIQALINSERGKVIDFAELRLIKAIERGESWAIAFCLKTIGKNRGYVERQEVTGADGGAVKMEITEELVDADNQKDLPADPPANAVPPE